MKYTPPTPVQLSPDEHELYLRLMSADDYTNDWAATAAAMASLFESLTNRGAIPDVRLRVFADPTYAETGTLSPKQIFEKNRTTGTRIIEHPHFLPYLRYFIEGPSLPQQVAAGLCQVLNEDAGTSVMVMEQYRRFARQSVRSHRLDPSKAATAFFRLGLEIGMSIDAARILRDAARTTR